MLGLGPAQRNPQNFDMRLAARAGQECTWLQNIHAKIAN